MSAEHTIRKALRDDGRFRGQDSAGNEWVFTVDDDDGEVWGYREVKNFGYRDEAVPAIAAFLAEPRP